MTQTKSPNSSRNCAAHRANPAEWKQRLQKSSRKIFVRARYFYIQRPNLAKISVPDLLKIIDAKYGE